MSSGLPLELADVEAAARRLAGRLRLTPLLGSPVLDQRLGAPLLVKAESLQVTGSFKYRGAGNALRVAAEAGALRAGAVAVSSGNHAQAVARVAAELGVPARIVMPADAPAAKRAGTLRWGARIISYDRRHERREAIAARVLAAGGGHLVLPFDDPLVMAGQGTVALEILQQLDELGLAPGRLLVPTSGGGLVAGCATVFAAAAPDAAVLAVEPFGHDDHARSLAAGSRLANAGHPPSLCDGLLAPEPGALTFAVNRRHLAGALAVTDGEVAEAMRLAFEHLRLVLEPSGAAGLAAALFRPLPPAAGATVVIATGGNVDADLFAAVLMGWPPAATGMR